MRFGCICYMFCRQNLFMKLCPMKSFLHPTLFQGWAVAYSEIVSSFHFLWKHISWKGKDMGKEIRASFIWWVLYLSLFFATEKSSYRKKSQSKLHGHMMVTEHKFQVFRKGALQQKHVLSTKYSQYPDMELIYDCTKSFPWWPESVDIKGALT